MKGTTVFLFIAMAALIMAASGQYLDIRGGKTYTVTTAGGAADADSATEATGTIGLKDIQGYKSLKGTIILDASHDHGLGLSDSGAISLRCVVGATSYLIDSTLAGTIPCSLRVVSASDTLLGGKLTITYWSWDSLGDTVYTATYPIRWDLRAY